MGTEQQTHAASTWRTWRAAGSALAIVLALAWGILLTGCDNQATDLESTIIIGTVTDVAGNPLAGVTVTPTWGGSGLRATTDALGNYALAGLSPSTKLMLTFERAGYLTELRHAAAIEGETTVFNTVMRTIGLRTNVNGAAPPPVQDAGGGVVILPGNGVVDASGKVVDGLIVEITTGKPTDAKYAHTAPGLFLAPAANGSGMEPLETYGFVSVVLKDAKGNIVNLKKGFTATVRIPVDPAADPLVTPIDLWRLDESTGRWVKYGTATRVVVGGKTYYETTVTHFTVWVIARKWGAAVAKLHVWEVVDFPAAGPVPLVPTVEPVDKVGGAAVTLNVTGTPSYMTTEYTNPNGYVNIVVPKGSYAVGGLWSVDAVKPGYTAAQLLAFRETNSGFEAWLAVKRLQQFLVDVKNPKNGLKVKVVQVTVMRPVPTTPPPATPAQTVIGPVANARVTATLFERQSGRRVVFNGVTDAAGFVTVSPEIGVYLGEFTAARTDLYMPRTIAYSHEPNGTALVTIGMVDKTGAAGGG